MSILLVSASSDDAENVVPVPFKLEIGITASFRGSEFYKKSGFLKF